MAITESVVAAVGDRLPGRPIARIALEIGALSGVEPDSVRFCFDVCVAGTPLEGAVLEIRETPGLAHCDACGDVVALNFPVGVCFCGSTELRITSGQELRIEEVEVRATLEAGAA
jgi:hydrogenase nickel incorporation protein HypA/HybF